MTTNFTFVPNDYPGARSRRFRSRRACEDCRHKKRRCPHQPGRSSRSQNLMWVDNPSILEPGDVTGTDPPSPSGRPVDGQQEQVHPQGYQPKEDQEPAQRLKPHVPPGPPTPRFVGDLNPEARLLDENTTPEDAQDMAPGEVGIWVQPKRCNTCGTAGKTCSSPTHYSPRGRESGRRQHSVSDLLSDSTIRALSHLYFANIHPVIPLLNKEEYWVSLSRGTVPAPLVHAVCLLAAKDNAARKHLKLLQSGDALVPVRPFCSQLYVSLSTALSWRPMVKKSILMRILGLLSLHQEGSDGVEQASGCIAQAMHHAQSMAMHLPRPNDVGNDLKRTFWCLWTLDRLNSATNSRPCIMADIDIAISDLTPDESGSVAFNVWFRIARMLNRVIGLYRPTTDEAVTGWDSGFSDFEQIMDEMDAWQLPPSTIATLHIFFLATAILAHRLKTITRLPSPTPARLRQQLSAIQVIRYMQDPDRLNALHPFPFVVYSISLALSVSYQQLRYSRLSSDQEDARQDFNTGCKILQELRRKWGAADAIGALAQRISGALDQLPYLDLLRVNRSDRAESHGRLAGSIPPRGSTEALDNQQQVDMSMAGRSTNSELTLPYLETMDLFASMDDVSWMYLDAENPVSLDSFPLIDFDGPYNGW